MPPGFRAWLWSLEGGGVPVDPVMTMAPTEELSWALRGAIGNDLSGLKGMIRSQIVSAVLWR